MNLVEVAIALIVHQGQILIARRFPDARLGGFWEFPGGKIHPGETPEQCMMREMLEETGLVVRSIRAFPPIEYDYEHGRVRLYPFLCDLISGQALPLAASEVRWVSIDELSDYRFPPANDALIRELKKAALRTSIRTSSSDPSRS